jgi:hypothetical protein
MSQVQTVAMLVLFNDRQLRIPAYVILSGYLDGEIFEIHKTNLF